VKISKITQEQEAMLPIIVDKWVGYASEPVDYIRAKSAIDKIYALMGEKPPTLLIAESPWSALLTASSLDVLSNDSSTLDSTLYSTLDSTLESLDKTSNEEAVKSALKKHFNNSYFCQYWSFWAGYYEYGKLIGVEFDEEKYEIFTNFIKEVSFIIPCKNLCIISQKPKVVNWLQKEVSIKGINPENTPKNRLLHNDGGKAFEYSDGWGEYCLNNIKVPQYLAETPAGLLDMEFFKKEKNADVKAEFIRKYGIDRMIHLGKEVDTYKNYKNKWWSKSEYKLIDMASIFTNINYAPHLYMKNQTTGTYHLEAVTPDCKNLVDAFSKVRWNGRDLNSYRTVDIK